MELSLATLTLSWVAGTLTTLSPCVFPLLPLVLGSALQANRWSPVVMGAGMAFSFALIGVLLGALGPLLGIDGDSIRIAGGWLLITFAVVMLVPIASRTFSGWMLPLATSANAVSQHLDSRSLGGAFALGAVLGLVWSPCSGPLLASALTLVVSEGNAAKGALVLGVFGIGAATPLVMVAYASRQGFTRSRDWVLAHVELLKRGFGLVLGLVGIAILTGADKWLEAELLTMLPDAWVQLTVRY